MSWWKLLGTLMIGLVVGGCVGWWSATKNDSKQAEISQHDTVLPIIADIGRCTEVSTRLQHNHTESQSYGVEHSIPVATPKYQVPESYKDNQLVGLISNSINNEHSFSKAIRNALEKGEIEPNQILRENAAYYTPLYAALAIRSDDLTSDDIRALLEMGEIPQSNGAWARMLAAMPPELIAPLIEYGYYPESGKEKGSDLTSMALSSKNYPLAESLLNAGYKPGLTRNQGKAYEFDLLTSAARWQLIGGEEQELSKLLVKYRIFKPEQIASAMTQQCELRRSSFEANYLK